MDYNIIKEQLLEYIKTPTVLVTKDNVPYEFNANGGSINRLKQRRYNKNIPLYLYKFLVDNNITKTQLMEFSSGLFLNYIEMSKIYI